MPLASTTLISVDLFDTVTAWETPSFATTVTLRRDNATIAAQACRLTTPKSAGIAQSDGAEQAEAAIVVIGATDMDIEEGDRFNTDDGTLVEVDMIRPIRTVHTVAFAKAVQR